jgi:hypothetical protein
LQLFPPLHLILYSCIHQNPVAKCAFGEHSVKTHVRKYEHKQKEMIWGDIRISHLQWWCLQFSLLCSHKAKSEYVPYSSGTQISGWWPVSWPFSLVVLTTWRKTVAVAQITATIWFLWVLRPIQVPPWKFLVLDEDEWKSCFLPCNSAPVQLCRWSKVVVGSREVAVVFPSGRRL